jgi:hypothetical protein
VTACLYWTVQENQVGQYKRTFAFNGLSHHLWSARSLTPTNPKFSRVMPIFANQPGGWIQQLTIPPPIIQCSINYCRNFYWDPTFHEVQVPQHRRVVDKGQLTEILVLFVRLRYIILVSSLPRLLNHASNTCVDLVSCITFSHYHHWCPSFFIAFTKHITIFCWNKQPEILIECEKCKMFHFLVGDFMVTPTF